MRLLKGLHVHVPRTGGNTIRVSIGQHLHLFAHDATDSIIKRFEPKAWDSIYKFSVVRNPWTRAFSAWVLHSQMRQDRKARWKPELDWQRKNFHEWLHGDKKEGNWYFAYRPETLLLIDGKCPLDHVYKMEDGVSYNIRHVCQVLGVEAPARVGKLKNSFLPRHEYHEVIVDPEDIKLIAEHGAWEIDRFGYQFRDREIHG